MERKKYHSHREKARSYPEKFLTMIIDGMDQSKTNIPNTKLISKSTSSLWRLRTHITGVILHTKAPCGKLTYCFIDFIQYPHDSNLTLTVMINVLVDFSTQYRLPEVLYIQMDNTCRENKNKFVLTFCAILVEVGIFRKVNVNSYSNIYSQMEKCTLCVLCRICKKVYMYVACNKICMNQHFKLS